MSTTVGGSGGGERDRASVVRLLRETIVQLCRANAPFGGGRVEIDGIICITGSGNGQQLVVKVHEVLHDAVDQAPAPPHPGLFDRDRYLSSVEQTSADVAVEAKRRRLATPFDGLPTVLPLAPAALRPHQSALYDYLSRFGFSSSPRISADLDSRYRVKDLSLKSSTTAVTSGRRDGVDSAADGHTSPSRRPPSPLDATASNTSDQHVFPSQRQQPRFAMPSYAERWSPSRPIPAIPQCFVCGYQFSSAEALGEHNETVHSIFTCLCCFKTFTSRSNLERHSRLHTGHRPYSCPVCGKTFSRKDHLSNHATKHAYKCGTCTRRCSDQSALADHYRIEHPGLTLAAVCAYCNKGFSSVELYEEHVKVHPQFHVTAGESTAGDQAAAPAVPVRHQCQMCGFEAMDRVCLVQHQQLMHYTPMSLLRDAYNSSPTALQRLDRQSFRCIVCGFTTTTILALRQHEAVHLYDISNQAYATYNQCASRRSPPSENREKELSIHTEGYGCQHCRQRFDSYASLCQHVQELAAGASSEETFSVGSQHRDKRKQKQPKPVMAAEIADNEDEEVNVVSPASADEKKMDVRGTALSVSHAAQTSDGILSSSPANDAAHEIRMEPIRSIMNRSSLQLVKVRERLPAGSPSPPPLEHPEDDTTTTAEMSDITPPRLVRRKNSCEAGGDDLLSPSLRDVSNNSVHDVTSENNSSSCHGSLDDLALHNNNNDSKEGSSVSIKCENQWINGPLSEQSRCVVCGCECSDFTEMEAHCLSEHSRSPCMYCPKTFAQKANRDRHMCLHTGDRPYGCPECGERFSRGDKLKMHRVRTHGILYPLYGSRGTQRDRDSATSFTRSHSTSQSPMMLDCPDLDAAAATVTTAVLNGSAASQDGDSPPVTDSDLHGSTSVLSGGEWIDLRISMCRESTKLQSALAQPLEPFPKREITDDELASEQPGHGSM